PVIGGRCRVALVEDQINDLQHGGEAGRELSPARNLDRNALLGEGAPRPDDSLGNSSLRNQECPGYLLRRQASKQAQCKRNSRFSRQYRVAGSEYETQKIVADVIVGRRFEIPKRHLPALDLVDELLVLALEPLVSAEEIYGAMLRGGHQPRARIVRNA